jgi:ABC-type multidrug transport system fused ATPase/permease subunit
VIVPRGLTTWTLSFLRPHRGRATLLAALLAVEIALGALQPWPFKLVIDNVLNNDEHPFPEPWRSWIAAVAGDSLAGMLVVVVAAGVILQIANHLVSAFTTQVQVETGQRMVYDLRYRLFEHLQALGLHHHVSTGRGDAVYRIDVDAYAIENLVISGLFPLVTSVASLIVMFSILTSLSPTIALLSLAVVPFLFLCLRYYMTELVARAEQVKALESKLMERLYEVFAAIRLVKSYAREGYEVKRYARFGEEVRQTRVAITWQESMFGLIVATITILGTGLVVVVGGLHVLDGRMSIGELTVVIAYLGAVYGPLSSIAHTTGRLQDAVAGAGRVRAMLAMRTEAADPPDGVDAPPFTGRIEFDHVGFSYPDGTRVLQDVSFTVQPGQLLAVVGRTGSGKTTLVSLIPRFYTASAGAVRIDGLDVRRVRIRSLREQIAIVVQDPVLFAGSVADNIRYGRLDATDEEVEAAARAAYAHEFIMRLPAQYRTEIAEAGGTLSGGERQRINIARALLKNAPILIMDEPTSALDAVSEATVFDALRRLRAGRTTLVIAHRLSTIRGADCIVVLEGGGVSAYGTHDELLRTNALYREMCARLSVQGTSGGSGDSGEAAPREEAGTR